MQLGPHVGSAGRPERARHQPSAGVRCKAWPRIVSVLCSSTWQPDTNAKKYDLAEAAVTAYLCICLPIPNDPTCATDWDGFLLQIEEVSRVKWPTHTELLA